MKERKSKGYALHNEDGHWSNRLSNKLWINLMALWTDVLILILFGVAWKVGLQEDDAECYFFSVVVMALIVIIILGVAALLGTASRELLSYLVTRAVVKKLRQILSLKQTSKIQSYSMIVWRQFTKYVDDSESEFSELCETNAAVFAILLGSIATLSGFAVQQLSFYFAEVFVIGISGIMAVVICVQDAIVLAFEDVRQELLEKACVKRNRG